jgi:hypothetical protein
VPLPNRAAPDGSLHAVPARGTLTGNRGIIHDPLTRAPTGRRWTTRAWIACSLHYKGVRRNVWGYNRQGQTGWSELFFLDEVTALAAGHRPCFACRRADALRFGAAFGAGNGIADGKAPAMDEILHAERLISSAKPPLPLNAKGLAALPDGAVIRSGEAFFALQGGRALPWSFSGYGGRVALSRFADMPLSLVTPPSIVKALAAGYVPAWHDSASA